MISFRPHPTVDAILFEFSGEFTIDEYLEGMESFLASDLFKPGIDSLWDFRLVSVDSVTPEVLRAVARYNESLAPHRGDSWRVALVVSAEVAFGLSRMFTTYVESAPNDIRVFRNIKDAENWLAED